MFFAFGLTLCACDGGGGTTDAGSDGAAETGGPGGAGGPGGGGGAGAGMMDGGADLVTDGGADLAMDVGADLAMDVGAETGATDASDVSLGDAAAELATVCGTAWSFIGDFDGDNVDDCATWPSNTRSLEFRKGLGGGLVRTAAVMTVSPGFCLPNPGSVGYVVVGDSNGDGRDDLVVVGGAAGDDPTTAALVAGGADGHFVCPGGGGGAFPTMLPTYLATGIAPIVGNFFTGDVGDDVLLVGYTVASSGNNNVLLFTVLDGNRSPIALKPFYTDTGFMAGSTGMLTSVSVSDVNMDGKLDIVTNVFVRYGNGTGPGATTVTWYGKGDGTFQKMAP